MEWVEDTEPAGWNRRNHNSFFPVNGFIHLHRKMKDVKSKIAGDEREKMFQLKHSFAM